MSITKRLIAGSAASWFQIGITVLSQILLVPVYLSSWNVQTYGIWITIQALISIFSTIDLGHQTFLGYEFLKIGQNDLKETSRQLWSGVWIGLLIGLFQVGLIAILLASGLFETLLIEQTQLPPHLLQEAGLVLLLNSIVWLLTGSAGGIFVRALTAFNYYPRLAWWGVFASIITALSPAIAVANGAGLLVAGIASASATLIFNLFLYLDIFRLLRKKGICYYKGSAKLGYNNFSKSLILSGKNLLENARVVGVRVILAPLAGAQALVTFATIRTGANFAMQGLHSVTNPLMPELMKFLHERDQERSETAFGTIWIVIVAVMAPGVVILQTVIEPLFTTWTRNKIEFNPLLFAILSITVLIYAIAQPAVAVVTGNNLLKTQLILSSAAAVVMIIGILILVPRIGILGAGIALLAAEILSTAGYIFAAKKWLLNNGLNWPSLSAVIAARSIWIATASLVALIYFPEEKWITLTCSMILMTLNFQRYWFSLPAFARTRSLSMINFLSIVK